jgi:hypothetical protein
VEPLLATVWVDELTPLATFVAVADDVILTAAVGTVLPPPPDELLPPPPPQPATSNTMPKGTSFKCKFFTTFTSVVGLDTE